MHRADLPLNTPPDADAWPDAVDSDAAVEAIAARAIRRATPCGDGTVVWHDWTPAAGTAGESTHSPVVLLHGGSGSWTHWVRNIGALVRAGRRVLAPDLPGFGDSALAPGRQDADAAPAPLERGLRTLLGDAPVDLVGFSYGALVGGLWAQAQPRRVARFVLVGAPALSEEFVPGIVIQPWSLMPRGPRRDAAHRHNLRALMLAHDEAVDDFALALHAANVERDRMRRRRLMLTAVLRDLLPSLRCAVGGLWGREDVLYRHRLSMIEPTLARAPRFAGLHLIAGAGHWVQFERPDAFDDALAMLLRGATPAP